ncbi:MAG: SGNH/GDSL hydrolase family protein [Calothrix sp. C42_A2020_038]|nr:SGNH/GDSL hydrolase family protein [Calothrix sp. C42_A2020_038]
MLLKVLVICLGFFLAIEVGLRLLFGFGNPLIYISDDTIGYLLAPNQRTRRNGNYIEINEYSMRGAAIQKLPSQETLRVFLLGDSIANGGWWTDQSNTISSQIMQSLTNIYSKVEVLNASANSWGPSNELAYLQKFGTFGAQAIILLINTDDLFATAPTSLPVGREKNYPDRKPALALVEVFQRYVQKSKPIPELQKVQQKGGDRVGINLEAIAKIQDIANTHNSKFVLAMTPLKRELGEPGSRDYEIKARARLEEFAKVRLIHYIDFLPLFNGHQNSESLYHDHIHLNLQGNQFVSKIIKQSLLEVLGQKAYILQ